MKKEKTKSSGRKSKEESKKKVAWGKAARGANEKPWNMVTITGRGKKETKKRKMSRGHTQPTKNRSRIDEGA